jgi:hypothetical protein
MHGIKIPFLASHCYSYLCCKFIIWSYHGALLPWRRGLSVPPYTYFRLRLQILFLLEFWSIRAFRFFNHLYPVKGLKTFHFWRLCFFWPLLVSRKCSHLTSKFYIFRYLFLNIILLLYVNYFSYRNLGSHSGCYEEFYLLEYNAVYCYLLRTGFFASLILRPWGWWGHVPLKRRLPFNRLHGVIFQKILFTGFLVCVNCRPCISTISKRIFFYYSSMQTNRVTMFHLFSFNHFRDKSKMWCCG